MRLWKSWGENKGGGGGVIRKKKFLSIISVMLAYYDSG